MVSHMQASWQEYVEQGKSAFDQKEIELGNDLFNRALAAAHEAEATEEVIGEIFFTFGNCLLAAGDSGNANQRLNQALRTFERALGKNSEQASAVREKLSQFMARKSQRLNGRPDDPTYEQIMTAHPAAATDEEASTKIKQIAVNDFIHPREKIYGFATAAISIWVYFLLMICLVGFAIGPLALLAGFITAGIHLGHLRSRGIKVSPRQFPEIYNLVDAYSTALNMPQPEVYVVQEHGLLNAFANRLHRKDIIVIYSDVVELAYEMGEKEMAFVVCHELAHIKRDHVKLAWLHMAGDLVPFLGSAYSRACEYTCDRIAAEIVPDGALFGLVCLAAGTKLYKRVNLKALYEQAEEEWNFWTWFTEIQSTHPNLMNRIRSIGLRDKALQGFHKLAETKAGVK
jgi:Zn-dependent protease with chaperone function